MWTSFPSAKFLWEKLLENLSNFFSLKCFAQEKEIYPQFLWIKNFFHILRQSPNFDALLFEKIVDSIIRRLTFDQFVFEKLVILPGLFHFMIDKVGGESL